MPERGLFGGPCSGSSIDSHIGDSPHTTESCIMLRHWNLGQLLRIVLALAVLSFAGCGRKFETAPPVKDPYANPQTLIDLLKSKETADRGFAAGRLGQLKSQE